MKKTLLITVLSMFSVLTFAQKNTSQSYIEQFKDNAISIMHETGIPASIILGIAMHESGNGNSTIAQHLNNQFGMKGGSGVTFYKNNKKVHSAYKQYDSILASFRDFARVITEKKKFSHLAEELDQYDYEKWVKGIQHAGYASSKKWGSDVLSIIHKYKLNDLDADKPKEDPKLAENNQ